eukprot:gb/GECH01009857.1/.p1 GENE.gb/GECH01009857.1/~~gb/GECH01009857.1/.p1  ORF type:complete len:192 (+),score=34.56 gb/GECH01009857.1/:1-576(+)
MNTQANQSSNYPYCINNIGDQLRQHSRKIDGIPIVHLTFRQFEATLVVKQFTTSIVFRGEAFSEYNQIRQAIYPDQSRFGSKDIWIRGNEHCSLYDFAKLLQNEQTIPKAMKMVHGAGMPKTLNFKPKRSLVNKIKNKNKKEGTTFQQSTIRMQSHLSKVEKARRLNGHIIRRRCNQKVKTGRQTKLIKIV